MTAEELSAAPAYKEMSADIARTKILLETQQKERNNFDRAYRKICDRVLVLLPQTAINKLEARSDWLDMSQAANVPQMRSAVLATVTNTDVRLYSHTSSGRIFVHTCPVPEPAKRRIPQRLLQLMPNRFLRPRSRQFLILAGQWTRPTGKKSPPAASPCRTRPRRSNGYAS